jgi:two-component system sensor histidine kinase ChiS
MKPPSPAEDPRSWEASDGLGIPEDPDGQRILVVEDDPAIREVLVSVLRLSGYRVRTASDGERLLEIARGLKPELVLMDLMLPGIDRWELTRRIKGDEELGAPPVIVLSARVRELDRARALEAGASHFIAKPCRAVELLDAVRTYLPARESGPGSQPP